jgi:ferredoxin
MPVSVEGGATVLEAAQKLDIEIPTLCHLKDSAPETSCMLCVVKDLATGRLIPSCSAKAVDGMEIDTECEAVQSARRDILNLLLSEHVGDCQAPCQRICPAHLDIPLMLREIGRGRHEAAAWIARRDLAIPVALGYICPAPCEKGCRRAQVDSAITIRDLHRGTGFQPLDVASRDGHPPSPSLRRKGSLLPGIGKKAAVIGSGAAGLSCAWKLLQLGYDSTVFDEAAAAGGSLREADELPGEVLDAEIEWLKAAGIKFELNAAPDAAGFDVVVEPEEHKIAVLAVARGKAAALDAAGAAEPPRFDFKLGKVRDPEARELVKNCPDGSQALRLPGADESRRPACGTKEQASLPARTEAARCLHCDCRKPESCKLRKYAGQYGADQREFPADERRHIELIGQGGEVVFEPGKCIKCGLCVRIIKRAGIEPGIAFTGRGYSTKVAVPFNESLEAGLKEAAKECVEVCPTGALAFTEGEELPIAD